MSFGLTGYSGGGDIPNQSTGLFGIGGKDWKFHLGNDMFADGEDRYRTASGRLSIGDLSAGFNLYTGDAGPYRTEKDNFKEIDGHHTYVANNGYEPDKYRLGATYIGYKHYKIGWNSESIRHTIQNKFAHDFITHGRSKHFRVLPNIFPGGIYGGIFTSNPYTLWAW